MNYEKGMILKKVKAGNDRTNIGVEITLVKKLANGAWRTTEIGTYTENYLNENFELVTKTKGEGGKMREFKVGDIVVSDEFGEGKVFEMYWDNLENMFYANVKFKGSEKNKLYFPKTGKRYTGFGTDTITLKEEEKVSKYKVGDTVTIKKDLKEDKYCNEGDTDGYYTISDMVKLAGKTTKIKKVFSGGYELEIDNSTYYWTDGMFEDVEIDKKKFKVGDIVCGNSSTRYGVTNTYMTKGEVVQVFDDGMFEVKIIEHKFYSGIGEKFSFLDPKYFDLVSRVKDTKLPNEKFGFKIGEKVMCMGNVETVIAFSERKNSNYVYITGYCDCPPSGADRPINNWAIVNKDMLQHIPETPVAKVGMYVKVTLEIGGAPVGSICKIISVSDSVFICYYYKKPDTERTNWYGTIDLGLELMPEDYRPMRVFTGDQIAEAEQIIGRLSVALSNSGVSYKLIRDGVETKINIYSEYSSGVFASGSTKRSPYDTDNSTIGLMIALCRAIGKRYMIPKWVFNG